ncbi:MAG: family 10 glycosylhydrolase [Bacteroidales bacterium]
MKLIQSLAIACSLFYCNPGHADTAPKREFRGTWVQTVHQSHYSGMNRSEMKSYFKKMLDDLQNAGINVLIFQIRPSADAFYPSDLEPWSRFLTGKQGRAPQTEWDPTAFLIDECHKRNIEFHAWLNPYRVTASANEQLSEDHIYNQHPEWFVKYDGKLYFDPGQPQCRKFFRNVIKDIITRYDVDAIHMDDYFYPYPVKGQRFPDEASFQAYHKKMNFSTSQLGDWRRQNVNILIKSIHEDIRSLKPWVRFGISPFGIYRNKKSDPQGSLTNGLQNYDDLYADVLRWTEEGWIDYLIPQLYWECGHKAADYDILIDWWNQNSNNTHLYIGQSISRSLDDNRNLTSADNHFNRKISKTRQSENISGNCFWYAYQIMDNEKKVADILKTKYHATPTLLPAYTHIDSEAPKEVRKVKTRWTENGYEMQWKRRDTDDEMQKQIYFCIYRFKRGEKRDLNNSENLIATTRDTYYLLPYEDGKNRFDYVVTSVDRMHNESKKGARKKVKL